MFFVSLDFYDKDTFTLVEIPNFLKEKYESDNCHSRLWANMLIVNTVSKNFNEIYIFYPWNVSKILLSLAASKQGVKNMYCILAALLIKSFKKHIKNA